MIDGSGRLIEQESRSQYSNDNKSSRSACMRFHADDRSLLRRNLRRQLYRQAQPARGQAHPGIQESVTQWSESGRPPANAIGIAAGA
jgi:hypothetical protein